MNQHLLPPKIKLGPYHQNGNIFTQAVEELDMIKDGDRLLVCLSGGKDSLSLLHTIRQFQFYCRGKVMLDRTDEWSKGDNSEYLKLSC